MAKKNRQPLSEADGLNTQGQFTAPIISGQRAEVLALIREHGPILSFTLTADYAIPETAARVHELLELGFNIQRRILGKVTFRGRERRSVAEYCIGVPEWPRPNWKASVAGAQADLFGEIEGDENERA